MSTERPELLIQIETTNHEAFVKTFTEWVSQPSYIEMPQVDIERAKLVCNPKKNLKTETFLQIMRDEVGAARKSGNYDEALRVLAVHYDKAQKTFKDDDLTNVLRFIYYRAGYVLETRATFGDLSSKPLEDPQRKECFVKAATFYMKSDLVVGCVTDYAGRVFESLNGAQNPYGEFAGKALIKFMGPGTMVVGPDDPAGQALINDIKGRSKDVRKGAMPGGGDVILLTSKDLPPSRVN